MPFLLVRIDDRLIHGQVTVAWGTWLEPDRIVLVNDDVASTEWKRELYAGTDALGAAVTILSCDEFISKHSCGDPWSSERVLLVVESPADLLHLMRGGFKVESANVGGMHHSEGKRELLPYVYVGESDEQAMREILDLGTRLEARDVPQAQSVDLSRLLRRAEDRT